MEREEVIDLVRGHLAEELEVDPGRIEESTRFREDLEADSLDLYELVMELEDRYGIKVTEEEATRIQDAYLGGDRKAAEAMVPAALIEGMSLIGDVGFVRDRIAAYREAGVTILNVQPIGPNGTDDIETIADWLT